MEDNQYIYQYRAVAFLDVLGFKNILKDFEEEAVNGDPDPGEEGGRLSVSYTSPKANIFINTFQKAVGKLDKDRFSYYLFSDNICITSIANTEPADLMELFMVISELYFDFVQQGYFLRGGIDYGLFLNDERMAVGVPLATAYELETRKAVFPRIVLSQRLIDQFLDYDRDQESFFNNPFAETIVERSCEIHFLNVFLHVFQSDYRESKEGFFSCYCQTIKENLDLNNTNEAIFIKYKWLADQYNKFVDEFVDKLSYLDENVNPDEEEGFLDAITEMKISYGN